MYYVNSHYDVFYLGLKQYGYITIGYVSRYRAHDTIRIAICFMLVHVLQKSEHGERTY